MMKRDCIPVCEVEGVRILLGVHEEMQRCRGSPFMCEAPCKEAHEENGQGKSMGHGWAST